MADGGKRPHSGRTQTDMDNPAGWRNLGGYLYHLRIPHTAHPLLLLVLSGLCYGLLIPWLGYYWDDWAFLWVAEKLGSGGLERYFATNRPFWGMIFRLTTSLINSTVPWHWQVFGLVWRWLSAVAFWLLLRRTWREQPQIAAWASALMVVYPAFSQQPIAVNYGHFFIVLTAYLLSCVLGVQALRQPRKAWLFNPPALLLAAVNLLAMEYFYLLELLRPLWLWFALSKDGATARLRLRRTLIAWLPFLALFVGVTVWRAFFFPYQTQNYAPVLLESLRQQPLATLLQLSGTIARDLWLTGIAAWGYAFRLPDIAELGTRTTLFYALLVAGTTLLCWMALALSCPRSGHSYPRSGHSYPNDEAAPRRKPAAQAALLGFTAMLVAGVPIWVVNVPLGFDFPNSRFTLPFMVGACLLLTALLALLPARAWIRTTLLALLIGFSVGVQFQSASAFRRDWQYQKSLFWQMTWRMPALQPGTTLLFNDLPIQFASDNSLTAPLNWIYAPENHSQHMDYMLYVTLVRLGLGLPQLQPGLPIYQNYLAAEFEGSTSQVVALHFEPPGCLRVLDADIEPHNKMLPELSRQAAALSNTRWILPLSQGETDATPPPHIFGEEPRRDWCYYYASADLARQQGDWQALATLAEQAFALGEYPNDPVERLVFIEGYARSGDWQRAAELTRQAADITPLMQPLLCRLWQRIADESGRAIPEIEEMHGELGCNDQL